MPNSLHLRSFQSLRPFTAVLPRILAAGLLGGASLLGGCSDETVTKSHSFDVAFQAAAKEALATTDAFSTDPSQTALTRLTSLAGELKSLTGATQSQTDAARALAASLYRKIGAAQFARARGIEQDECTARAVALALADSAARLEGLATGFENADIDANRADPEALRDDHSARGQTIRAVAAQGAAQLTELERQIEAMHASVGRLETDAAVLLLKARQSGATAGYPFVAEAARLTADASAMKVSMSAIVAQLDAAAPLVQLASLSGETSTAIADAAESQLDQLSKLEGALDAQAKSARELSGRMRDSAIATLAQIDAERAGPLADTYTAASDALDQSATLARGGSSNDALAMEIHIERAQIMLSALRGMTDQAREYAMLSNTGTLFGGEARFATQVNALKADAETRITALREQLLAGIDATQSLGEDAQSVATKKWFEDAKKSADALNVDTLFAPPAPIAVASPATTPKATAAKPSALGSGSAGASGFPTPADLAAALNASRVDPKADPTKVFSASSAGGKAMLSVLSLVMKEMIPLREAVAKKFGVEALGAIGSIGEGMGIPSSAMNSTADLTVGEIDGDNGTLVGGDASLPIVKTPTGWLVDFNALLESSGADMTQMEQMAPMMKAGMAMMMPMLKKAIAGVVAEVESGEIADAAGIGPALEKAMAESMGLGRGG